MTGSPEVSVHHDPTLASQQRYVPFGPSCPTGTLWENVSVAPGAIATRGTRWLSERPVERLVNLAPTSGVYPPYQIRFRGSNPLLR